jgi:hypothetical protein
MNPRFKSKTLSEFKPDKCPNTIPESCAEEIFETRLVENVVKNSYSYK